MDLRHIVASSLIAASSLVMGCSSLNVYSYAENGDRIVQAAFDAFPASLKDSLGAFDVVIVPGPITSVRKLAYLSGRPAPGQAKIWDDVPMATLGTTAYVSISNTRRYFRGMSALEEEGWHVLDDRLDLSRSPTFRALAADQLRFYTNENYGDVSLDTKFREIFADFADRYTDPDGHVILHRAYPALTAWFDALDASLERGPGACKTLKASR